MTKKKRYYPNNWQEYKDAPDKFFLPLAFDEFMDWKIAGWELPSSVSCIIRERNTITGKVKEYTYSRVGDAKNKCRAIMDIGESEFTVCTREAVHFMQPELNYDPFEDPLA
jgi:hypothetical protein